MKKTLSEIILSNIKNIAKKESLTELGDRSQYIGSSDISGCLLSAYNNKLNPADLEDNKYIIFQRGHLAETIIKKAFFNEGLKVEEQVELINKDFCDMPLKAHIDFLIKGKNELVIVEVKTTSSALGEVPLESWLKQIHFQWLLLKNKSSLPIRGFIVAMNLNTGEIKDYPVEFNSAIAELVLQQAKTLSNALLTKTAPKPSTQLFCGTCPYKMQCSDFVKNSKELTEDNLDIIDLLERTKSLSDEVKEKNKTLDKLKQEVIPFIKEFGSIKINNSVFTLTKDTVSKSFDSKTFSIDYPELYEKYTKEVLRNGYLQIK